MTVAIRDHVKWNCTPIQHSTPKANITLFAPCLPLTVAVKIHSLARSEATFHFSPTGLPLSMNSPLAPALREHGAIDVAGGSGELSMLLSMKGVQATVVDPRSSPRPPRRQRKILRKSGGAQVDLVRFGSVRFSLVLFGTVR